MPYSDRQQQRDYQKQWKASRRDEWIRANGGRCRECGTTENLEVDHIDPEKKSYNPTYAWSRANRKSELDKCQVLCRGCHARKTYSARAAQHGTQLAYNRDKCRCDLCKEWNRQRVRRQRKTST